MSLKSFLAKQFAKFIYKKTKSWADNPVETQQTVFEDIIRQFSANQFTSNGFPASIGPDLSFVTKVDVVANPFTPNIDNIA